MTFGVAAHLIIWKMQLLHSQGLLLVEKDVHYLDGTLHNVGARAKDCGNASLVEVVIVLHGDYTASGDDDVLTTQLLEFLDNGGDQGLVTRGEGNKDNTLGADSGSWSESIEICFHYPPY